MSYRNRALFAVPVLVSGAFAPISAAADVTPDGVWEGLRAYLETSGYSVEANRSRSGDDVVVEGLTATMSMAEDGQDGELTFEASRITFEDQGDGTVRVLFPESMPITITTDAADQPETTVSLDYTHTGLTILVSGSDDNQQYDLSADTLGMSLDEIVVDGTPVPPEMGNGSFSLAALTGTMQMAYGDLMSITQNLRAESLSYDVSFTDPDTGDTGSLSGAMSDIAIDGGGDVPEMEPDMQADAMVAAGLDVEGSFTYASGQSRFTGTSEGEPVEGQTSSTGGNFSFALSQDGLQYGLGAENIAMSATVPDLPFPISVSMDKLQTNTALPVSASEEPQDFSMLIELAGLEVADMIWMMFDPTEILPRDPATLLIDVTGQATSFLSILDPEAMEGAEGAPGELNAVTINAVRLEAAGAELNAEGAFTINNSDTETFDGMPAPEGEATMTLTGANALIDRLIEMGILSNEDAMGARMMISMFSVPGDAADTLTSTVTITEDGQVLANGQRLR
ncbi:hypothetical protein FIU97_01540 [Roseivivax sp. THAF40]|uniref:DUF2125 domain-containing protein n=1 Tax=unclassified Roseivivax TaxID=2639302 RepID=UPI00126916D3|nr:MULTISPECIES: DUF2125 domain-containing protein [unclassified Roseivivax]QFS81517.1 hypothetical protein FIV09_01630 [Roseivivax sp. THAF197b]QFT45246.1 hypothetical protein FIU97_01540 [Roseivivax sp. THAF40]